MSKLEKILEFTSINARLATAGQPSAKQFSLLADEGFELVINLALSDSPGAIKNEKAHVIAAQMAYTHIPVPFDQPRPHHLQTFLTCLEDAGKQKVLVHCVKNYRASSFVYHHLRQLGWSHDRAQATLPAHWQANEVWQKFLAWSVSA